MTQSKLDQLCVTTIKMLAADAVEKANSGHPGMPMGCADLAFVLWNRFLTLSPDNPSWVNRDRFILSAGHGSMLLYAMLHLSGFDVSLEDLKQFRQWGSKTPGHPEYGHTPGVECTTGPLGQGTANAVGMALAAKMAQAKLSRSDWNPLDHNIFALVSDGDLMEGISSEATSLAGHLGLSNLIFIYDSNHISIDGSTSLAFSEDIAKRFEAHQWSVQRIDGHDHEQIQQALDQAVKETQKPSLIIARTHIGHGSPNKQDKSSAHGAPLGEQELKKTKEHLGWPSDESFVVPEEVRDHFAKLQQRWKQTQTSWEQRLTHTQESDPAWATRWNSHWEKKIPADLYQELLSHVSEKDEATRILSSQTQQHVAALVPSLVGGSADLASSCKTWINDSKEIQKDQFEGRNIHFGIREHAMGAMINGMSLYGGWIPYASTFLVFSDYVRPAIRLAALSHIQSLFVFTHDSLHVGEDGPTHQPVEHIPSLRLIPNVQVLRPADGMEVAACWTMALQKKDGPSCLILSRQTLQGVARHKTFEPEQILQGAYVVWENSQDPDIVLVASGSELALAMEVTLAMTQRSLTARLVSAPCLEVFAQQPETYRQRVLPRAKPTVSIEMTQPDGWYRHLGPKSLAIGVEEFGASAPGQRLTQEYGFTSQALETKIWDFYRKNAS
ncbi:MAG: transketolase [Bdellovibrionota bacterium]